MADPVKSVEEALADIPAGTKVHLQLKDSTEVEAVVQEGGQVKLDDAADPIQLQDVERVLVDVSSADPE
jgi:hypothetical protein